MNRSMSEGGHPFVPGSVDSIALVLPTLGVGGSEVVAAELASALSLAGKRVTVMVTGESGPVRSRISDTVNVRLLATGRARHSIGALRSELRPGRYDVVATFHVQMAAAVAIATFGTDCRRVVSEHSLVLNRSRRLSFWRRPLRRGLLRFSYRRAFVVVVPSTQARDQVIAVAGRAVQPSVVPSPLLHAETNRTTPPLHRWFGDSAGPVVVVVGRVAPEKRLALAASIVARARGRGTCARLIVVGPDAAGEAAALAANEPDWADWVGEVADPTPWIWAADALLVTSEFESFGNVIIEAADADTPVLVVGTQGAPRDLLASVGGGRFVSDRSVDSAADALQAVIAGEAPTPDRSNLAAYEVKAAADAFLRVLGG